MTLRTLVIAAALLTAAPASAQAACATDSMPPDMFRAYVEGTQKALAEHGFRPGTPDGKMGRKTQAAVRAYQRAAKLPVDGCVSKDLLDHLNFAQPRVQAGGR